MASVDGLLQDFMHIGSDIPLHKEQLNARSVVNSVITELLKGHPDAKIEIDVSIPQNLAIFADESKIKRVFTNILLNAFEAISFKGKVWIHARTTEGSIEFTIGNEGSVIPPEMIDTVFGQFFTSAKKGGPGLRLAIAKKWMDAHDGHICCRSDRNVVEFVLSLRDFASIPNMIASPTHLSEDVPRHQQQRPPDGPTG